MTTHTSPQPAGLPWNLRLKAPGECFGTKIMKLLPLLLLLAWPAAAQAQTEFYGGNISGDIIIPHTFYGQTVTDIGDFFPAPNLLDVVIPASVTNMDDSTFDDDTGLTCMSVPGSIPSIGSGVFDGCTNINTLLLFNGLTSIGDYAFAGVGTTTLVIPDTVTNLGNGVFEVNSLISLTIPNSVTSIGTELFAFCPNLTTVSFPNNTNITSIGTEMFAYCPNLTGLTLPNSITNIGSKAFIECTSLTSMNIPSSVTGLGTEAFANCGVNLASVHFAGNAPTNDGTAFNGDSKTTVYYEPGTTGWGSTFGGAPTVEQSAVITMPAPFPFGSTFAAYSQTATASGGATPYVFTVSSGSLPPGYPHQQRRV